MLLGVLDDDLGHRHRHDDRAIVADDDDVARHDGDATARDGDVDRIGKDLVLHVVVRSPALQPQREVELFDVRPNVEKLDLALWLKRWTPNYHVQNEIFPNAVNVTVACGGVTVVPGDIIVVGDDGAVVVPVSMAEVIIEDAKKHADWEEFSRMKLMQGESLKRYYPLHPDAQAEYESWRRLHPRKS